MKPESRGHFSQKWHEHRSESGQALVLVLVLLIVGSLLVVALANAAASDLRNTGAFSKARSVSYDATSAIDVAIQSIRYKPLLTATESLNASPPVPCWPTTKEGGTWSTGEPPGALPNTGGNVFRVWCSTRWTPASARTRTVTFSACKVSSASPPPVTKTEAKACALKPLVQEVVAFDDYPAGKATPTQAPCHTWCGEFMTVESWVEHPKLPSVSFLSCVPTSASCTKSPIGGPSSGGTIINIIGNGFVTGSVVQFVEETGGTPNSDNVVLTATKVTYSSATALTATVPGITEGSTYFVTVTTPTGTSAYGSRDVFTYSYVRPTVTSVCSTDTQSCTTPSGPVSGGTEVTIHGTSFLCLTSCASGGGPTVDFGGVQAQYVTIVSTTEITATTPPEYSTKPPKSVAVTVTTPGGTSPASADYEYVAIVPTVESVTYNTKTQTVIINGTGFVVGQDSVTFTAAKSTGAPTTRTTKTSASVTVDSSTTLTATVPTGTRTGLTKTETYFVTVTASGVGTSTFYPKFKYV
jgi:IPT/TIG domain